MSDTILRCATKADKRNIKRFYQQQRYPAKFKGLDTSYIVEQRNENKPYDGLENSNDIIACVIVSQLEANNPQLFLHALVVHQEYRKKGLAKQLISFVSNFINIENSLHFKSESIVCFCQPSLVPFYLASKFNLVSSESLNQLLNTRYQIYWKKEPDLKIMVLDIKD